MQIWIKRAWYLKNSRFSRIHVNSLLFFLGEINHVNSRFFFLQEERKAFLKEKLICFPIKKKKTKTNNYLLLYVALQKLKEIQLFNRNCFHVCFNYFWVVSLQVSESLARYSFFSYHFFFLSTSKTCNFCRTNYSKQTKKYRSYRSIMYNDERYFFAYSSGIHLRSSFFGSIYDYQV